MYKEGLQRTQDTQNRDFFNDGPPQNKITKIHCRTAYMRFDHCRCFKRTTMEGNPGSNFVLQLRAGDR